MNKMQVNLVLVLHTVYWYNDDRFGDVTAFQEIGILNEKKC